MNNRFTQAGSEDPYSQEELDEIASILDAEEAETARRKANHLCCSCGAPGAGIKGYCRSCYIHHVED